MRHHEVEAVLSQYFLVPFAKSVGSEECETIAIHDIPPNESAESSRTAHALLCCFWSQWQAAETAVGKNPTCGKSLIRGSRFVA